MILTYRYELGVSGIGPHYITSDFGQYNLDNLASGSSSTIFYLPPADWISGTGSVPGEHWYIYDIKSSYIYQGDGPKIYPNPQDVASGYAVTINTVTVASGGVATSTPFYQLLREGTIYKVTYEGFYNFTVVDLLASPDWYIDITYSTLRSNLLGAGNLIRGAFYRITDFFTCYDRPDFYMNPAAPNFAGEKNRKVNSALVSASASVSPIVVLATSQNTISTDAWQPAYPKDIIKYDITWSQTEFKGTAAKGRITERIDEYGNRTDYDHRDVEFIRYQWYNISTSIDDIASINFSAGLLTSMNAPGAWATPPTAGSVVLIEDPNNNQLWGVKLTTVNNGAGTATFTTDSNYSTATVTIPNMRAWIASGTKDFVSFSEVYLGQKAAGDFQIFKTFQWASEFSLTGTTQSVMNYIGNYADGFKSPTGDRFVLSNNVFGTECYSNTLGPESANNTVGGTVSTNPLYGGFYKNTSGSGFSNNIFNILGVGSAEYALNNFGENFFDNKIFTLFRNNTIGNSFANNFMFTFDQNSVGNLFYMNGKIDRFFRGSDNVIGNNIYLCLSGVIAGNTIGNNYTYVDFADGCNSNIFGNVWTSVTLKGGVRSNIIGNEIDTCVFGGAGGFNYNVLGNVYSNCQFSGTPGTTNAIEYNTLGNNYIQCIIESVFSHNQLGNGYDNVKFMDATGGQDHSYNTIGNAARTITIDTPSFYQNVIGNGFENNIIVGEFSYNIIGNEFKNNPITGMPSDGLVKFNYNTIGNYFVDNVVAQIFTHNTIGHRFTENTIGQYFQSNNIGDEFYKNTTDDYFQQNNIGCSFSTNNTGVYFKNNKIGDHFILNTIGMYFERNDIGDYFGNNTNFGGGALDNVISDYFQDNKIGNYFGNDGSGIDGGNLILSYFRNNKIGDNFIFNLVGDSVNSNQANFTDNNIGNDFSFNIIYDGFRNNEIGNVFLGNEIGDSTSGLANFESNDIGNFFGINIIDDDFKRNKIGDYFGNDGSVTLAYQTIGNNFSDNRIGNYFGNDGSNTQGENTIGVNFTNNTIDTRFFFSVVSGDGFRFNHFRQGANVNAFDFTVNPATHVFNTYTFIVDSFMDGVNSITWGHYYDYNGGLPNLIYDDPLL